MIIAIDGTSGSGKGTLAQRIADRLSLAYLDTGLLYRAVAWRLLQTNADLADIAAVNKAAQSLTATELSNPQLRDDKVAVVASKIAGLKSVREALLDFQRQFAACPPKDKQGVILDGRDIGTEVLPHAEIKLYLTASLEVRAQRRYKELQNLGIKRIYSAVLQDMQTRDQRDAQRMLSPTRPAADALVLDTSEMGIDDVLNRAIAYIMDKRKLAS